MPTAYDAEGYLAPNALARYALHNWDELTFAQDGSLTLYFGASAPPPPANQSNWLPAPSQGNWSLTARFYWPQDALLDGNWTLPALLPAVPARVVS